MRHHTLQRDPLPRCCQTVSGASSRSRSSTDHPVGPDRSRQRGRGYSGERAAALFEVAFERLDLDLVAVVAFVDNERSKRAIETYTEAYGGSRDGLLRNWRVQDGEPIDCVRYSVSRSAWEENLTNVEVALED